MRLLRRVPGLRTFFFVPLFTYSLPFFLVHRSGCTSSGVHPDILSAGSRAGGGGDPRRNGHEHRQHRSGRETVGAKLSREGHTQPRHASLNQRQRLPFDVDAVIKPTVLRCVSVL